MLTQEQLQNIFDRVSHPDHEKRYGDVILNGPGVSEVVMPTHCSCEPEVPLLDNGEVCDHCGLLR